MALLNFDFSESTEEKKRKAQEEAREQYMGLLGTSPVTQQAPQEGPVRPGEFLPPINQTTQGSGLLGGPVGQDYVSPQEMLLRTAGMPGNIGSNALAAMKQLSPQRQNVKPSYKVVPESIGGGQWRSREVIDGLKGSFIGEPYSKSASASDINIGGSSKYEDQRMKSQAVRMDDLAKQARSSYKEMQALDRFTKAGMNATAGGAQPIISGVKNFLSSFGYDSKSLTNVRVMEQAIADMKVNKIAQFGARGLTDKDMEVIHKALARINIDPNARKEVADILRKMHENTIQDYIYSREEEAERFPKMSKQIMNPRWLNEYNLNQPPEGVGKDIWDNMPPEDRKLWKKLR